MALNSRQNKWVAQSKLFDSERFLFDGTAQSLEERGARF